MPLDPKQKEWLTALASHAPGGGDVCIAPAPDDAAQMTPAVPAGNGAAQAGDGGVCVQPASGAGAPPPAPAAESGMTGADATSRQGNDGMTGGMCIPSPQARLLVEAGLPTTAAATSSDGCFTPKLALAGAIAAAVAAAGAGIALLLAPDPTTLTKWAAVGAAAGVISAIVGVIAAIEAVIDCEQAAKDAATNKQEIEELKRRQKQLQETVDKIKEAMGNK